MDEWNVMAGQKGQTKEEATPESAAVAGLPGIGQESTPKAEQHEGHPDESAQLIHVSINVNGEAAQREGNSGQGSAKGGKVERAREPVKEVSGQEVVQDEQGL